MGFRTRIKLAHRNETNDSKCKHTVRYGVCVGEEAEGVIMLLNKATALIKLITFNTSPSAPLNTLN